MTASMSNRPLGSRPSRSQSDSDSSIRRQWTVMVLMLLEAMTEHTRRLLLLRRTEDEVSGELGGLSTY